MRATGTGTAAPPSRASLLACWAVTLGLLCCVVAAVPSPLFDLDRHSVPKELCLHLTALVTAVLLLLSAKETALSKLDVVLALWLVAGVASALGAANPWLAQRSLSVAVSGATVFWVARALSRQGLAQGLQGAVAAATVLAAATALAQAYGADLPVFAETRVPGGTFGNRNFMAHALALGAPTLVLVGLRSRSAPARLAASLGTVAVAAALVLSRTRAAWLAVGLAAAVALLLGATSAGLRRSPELRRRAAAFLLASLAGAGLALCLPNSLDWRSSNPYLESAMGVVDYKKGSGKGRLIQYRNTLGMAADHPALGVGPGNWPVEYALYASRGDPSLGAQGLMPTNPWPSSDWVGFLVEWGPAGAGLFALMLGVLWVRGWGGARQARRWEDGATAAALAATATSAAVVGAVDSVLHLAAPSFLFWAAAGSLAPPATPVDRRRIGALLRLLGVCAALAAGGVAAVRSGAQTAALLKAGRGSSLQDVETASHLDPGSYRLHMLAAEGWARRGRCEKAGPHALAASRLFPHLPEPKRLAAACGK